MIEFLSVLHTVGDLMHVIAGSLALITVVMQRRDR
jgi:hypothetical protein